MTDSSTITFFVIIAATFAVMRWYLLSQPSSSTSNTSTSRASNTIRRGELQHQNAPAQAASNSIFSRASRGYRRPVTLSMIEVVQTLGPQLTVDQIRYDLERSGSVELTVERYLSTGTLPIPPNTAPVRFESSPSSSSSSSSSLSSHTDLISKYNLSEAVKQQSKDTLDQPLPKMKWTTNKEERQAQLKRQQQEMVLRARRKLELKKQEMK